MLAMPEGAKGFALDTTIGLLLYDPSKCVSHTNSRVSYEGQLKQKEVRREEDAECRDRYR